MSFLKKLNFQSNKIELIVDLSKIFIILFISLYLIGNFIPFYQGFDAYIFGISALNLSEGSFSITNKLLKDTGEWTFVPRHWSKTISNDAVPNIEIGFPLLGAFSYMIGGYYGLFYLGPIFTIIFFIINERISTKLFGRYVSLLSLIFLASSFWILKIGVQLMTDIPFSLFFILGSYYLIKYFHSYKDQFLWFASGFFVISSLLRTNGIVFLFSEIILVSIFLIFQYLQNKKDKQILLKNSSNIKLKNVYQNKSKIFNIILSIIIPWMLFFIIWFSINDYFFDDPFTSYLNIKRGEQTGIVFPPMLDDDEGGNKTITNKQKSSSLFDFEIDNMKGYFRAILPFPLSHQINFIENFSNTLGKYWLGFLTPFLIFFVLFFSILNKDKKIEMFVFTVLIVITIIFFASLSNADSALERQISPRYMIPLFSIFSMMLGYLILKIYNFSFSNFRFKNNFRLKWTMKFCLVILLISFFTIAFYFTPPIQLLLSGNYKINNPEVLAERYPLDMEGLSENSIIVDSKGYATHEYNAIPFTTVSDLVGEIDFNHKSIQINIDKIKKLMNEGYEIYIYKKPGGDVDKAFFEYLVINQIFVISDFSENFCKINLIENFHKKKSDENCFK